MKFVIIVLLSILAGCNNKDNIDLQNRLDYLEVLNANLVEARRNEIFFKGQIIDNSLPIINQNFDTLKVGDLGIGSDQLVFYYSDRDCADCLSKQLQLISNLFQSNEGSSIYIFAAVESFRSLASVTKLYGINCQMFRIPDYKSIFYNIPFTSYPFYITLNFDLRPKDIFIPISEDSLSTRLFLSSFAK